MDTVSLILSALTVICVLMLLYLHYGPSLGLRWPEARWESHDQRRALIIKTVAPLYLDAGRAVTPSMITRFVSETSGLSPRETGSRLNEMVSADFRDGQPFVAEVVRQ